MRKVNTLVNSIQRMIRAAAIARGGIRDIDHCSSFSFPGNVATSEHVFLLLNNWWLFDHKQMNWSICSIHVLHLNHGLQFQKLIQT